MGVAKMGVKPMSTSRPMLSGTMLRRLQDMAAERFMDATIKVYSQVLTRDNGGVEVETWPGMTGEPSGSPRYTLPGRIQQIVRVPNEDTPGDAKLVIAVFIIKLPVFWNNLPVVLIETDRFDSLDPYTGVLTSYKASNTYQGMTSQTSIDTYVEKFA